MVTIGTTDQVMALVRGQLERMARAKRAGGAGRTAKAEATTPASHGRLDALANLADLPDQEFERVLVRALLTEEFGEDAAADARFQSIVDRATTALRGDPRLGEAVSELRGKLA